MPLGAVGPVKHILLLWKPRNIGGSSVIGAHTTIFLPLEIAMIAFAAELAASLGILAGSGDQSLFLTAIFGPGIEDMLIVPLCLSLPE